MTSLDATPAELAGLLRALLEHIDADAMGASALLRARIEGALAAAEVLAGESAEGILARLEVGPTYPARSTVHPSTDSFT